MAQFDLSQYATVQDRIEEFYQEFPEGSIVTNIERLDGAEVIFEARIFRSPEDVMNGVFTNGFAREVEGKTPVNKTSHIENCETSAIGRALANLGYSTAAQRVSRSEMLKVARMQAEHAEMIAGITTLGKRLPDDAEGVIGGQTVKLKQYIRDHWAEIQEQYALARKVSEALDAVSLPEAAA